MHYCRIEEYLKMYSITCSLAMPLLGLIGLSNAQETSGNTYNFERFSRDGMRSGGCLWCSGVIGVAPASSLLDCALKLIGDGTVPQLLSFETVNGFCQRCSMVGNAASLSMGSNNTVYHFKQKDNQSGIAYTYSPTHVSRA